MNRTLTMGLTVLLGMTWAQVAQAQRRTGPDQREGPPHPEVTVDWTNVEERIAWFGTLERALAAAKRTKRPILFISGAPHCQFIPGVW